MPGDDRPALRLTPQRAAVLDVVRSAGDHPTAGEIFARVRRRRPGIGLATVYRALDVLVAHHLILELTLGDGSVSRYDGNTHSHDHVLCGGCGAVADVAVDLPPDAREQAELASGFTVTGHTLQFHGRCPACAGAQPAPILGP